MKRILVFLVCFPLVTGITFGQEKQSDELLSNAIYQEEVKGNLEGAILIYKDIIKKYPEQRAIAAEALFHLGLSNEKLGNKIAKEYYEQVVSNYGDQPEFVRIAKERLSSLMFIAEKVSETPLVPKFTKIKIPTKPGNGVLSPDGKRLAYVSEKSLWVLPVHGKTNTDIAGEPVRLTEPMEIWDLANMGMVWSANSKWLAYYATVTGEGKRKTDEIFIISAVGGKPVKVNLNQQRPDIGGYDYRMSLAPNGKMLAFVNRDDNKKSVIYTISTEGGTPTKLTEPGTREPVFSPDGKLIAYVKTNPKNDLGNEIWVIPSIGGNPVLVNDNASVVKSPVWSPDGSMIAFLAREYKQGWANNSNKVWIASVNKNGEPMGSSSKIDLNYSTLSMLAGWSQDNKIGFWLSTPDKNVVYSVPASGGQAMQVTPKDSWMPCWSPDGQYLYFYGVNTDDWAGIESIPVNGGDVTKIPIYSEYAIQPGMPTGGISISPDGKIIVFAGSYYNINDTVIQKNLKGLHIMTIPVKGGKPVQLTTNPEGDRYPVWSPDGKAIAFIRAEIETVNNISATTANIYTISAYGGTPIKITTSSDRVTNGRIDWSPDGKWIGFYSDDNTIKVISPEGGNPKIVINDVEPHPHYGLSFSPGGNKIAFSTKKKLITIDLNGENEAEVKTGLDEIPIMPAWSPDGEKIAFSAYTFGETDLWLMENFLPLEKLAQKKEKEKESFVIRKVIDGTDAEFEGGNPSPDGKYFAFTDWNTGNLAIYENNTGKKRLLTKEGSWESNQMRYTENSTWSPDGKQIVYNWWIDDDLTELRIIGLDDLKPRILYKNEEVLFAQTFDWSGDGKQILACFQKKDNSRQIVLVSTENGSVRVLKTLVGKIWMNNMSFSPDGRYIVYDLPPEEFSKNPDIFLMSTYGGHEISLVKHPAYDKVLGWAPDGKNILFASDRTGTFDAFVIQVTEGEPQGTPKLIKSDIGNLTPRGFTKKGSFYYSTSKEGNNVYTADLDPETGKILAPPKMAIKRFEGSNYYPYYSPDGKYIVYISGRNGQGIICIRNLETSEDKEFNLEGHNIKGARNFRWSSDCSSILVKGIDNKNRYGIFRINVQTGNFTPVIPWESWKSTYLHSVELSRDGKAVFYVDFNTSNKISQILVRDIETGIEKELYRFDTYINMSYSPDGKWLASSHPKSLKVMPASGGDPRELYTFKEEYNLGRPITWSADGKYILFSDKEPRQDGWELCRIPAEGGESRKLGLEIKNGFDNLSVHPNNRNIAFSSKEQKNAEFWVMENFLPKEEKENKQK